MSDDEGVTPFQGARDASIAAVTPPRCKGALGTWRSQGGARTLSRDKADPRSGDEMMSKPAASGVYVGRNLSQAATGKAQQGKPRSEPDRGNPAVRDRRGACRNVDKMGAGMRPGGKPRDSPPYPKMLRALHFYPDRHGRLKFEVQHLRNFNA